MPSSWLLALLVSLSLAGCVAPSDTAPGSPPATGPEEVAQAAHVEEGRAWFPPSLPTEGAVVTVTIPITRPGADVAIHLRKGIAPDLALPTSGSSVMAALLDPADTTLGEAMLAWSGPEEGAIDAADLASGDHVLQLTLYGASASEHGHFVAFRVATGFPTRTSEGSR